MESEDKVLAYVAFDADLKDLSVMRARFMRRRLSFKDNSKVRLIIFLCLAAAFYSQTLDVWRTVIPNQTPQAIQVLLSIGTVAVVGCLIWILVDNWLIPILIRRNIRLELDGMIPMRCEITVTDQNVIMNYSRSSLSWMRKDIEKIDLRGDYLEVSFAENRCMILPLSAFKNEMEQQKYISALKSEL